ncbi:MAG: DUF4129 domain-containing protein [Pseudomarimonas sp.]
MRVDALAIALRARQGWEAIDLGFRMATHWARPLWIAWLAVYLPLTLALLAALYTEPMAAALAIWWSKPIADRFALFVLSRRVFGDPATLAQTLASWRSVLSPGLVRALLLRPFGWDRSFLQPIPLLERQRGVAARRRAALLGRRLGGHAMALAMVCLCFELVVMISLAMFGSLLTPAAEVGGAAVSSDLVEALGIDWWGMGVTLAYVVAIAVVEPFFVAAGFAMYLVRRTQLEGWDIELALRRAAVEASDQKPMATTRVGPPKLNPLSAVAIAVVAGFAVATAPPALADVAVNKGQLSASQFDDDLPPPPPPPLDTPARRAALEVLKHPDFGRKIERMRWRLDLGDEKKKDPSSTDLDWLRDVGDWVAAGVRVTMWVLLAILAMAVVWLVAKRTGGGRADAPLDLPPQQMFGLAISPDSLPDDVVAAALAAIADGHLREAVSLLYRGALSYLVHDCEMRIGEGSTEGEVLRIAQPLLSATAFAHFQRLVAAWIEIAYGHRPGNAEQLRALCHAQRNLFTATPSAGEVARSDLATAGAA